MTPAGTFFRDDLSCLSCSTFAQHRGAAGRIIFSVSVIKSQARGAFVPSALNLPSFVIEVALILT